MKAWKLVDKNKFELVSRDISEMDAQNDVKIKMNRVMLTSNDCYLVANPEDNQIVLGSVGIGIVSEVLDSSDSRFSRMERVVIEPYIPCNDCRYCKQSKYTDCINKQNLGVDSDGLLKDFICLPHSCLYTIPEIVSPNDAILVPMISLALNLIDKIQLEKGEHVAIFGGGILGVIVACLVNYYQAMPVFIAKDEHTVDIAKSKNIFYTFNNQKDDVRQNIFSLTGGRKCEKVIYLAEGSIPISLALESCGTNAILSFYSNCRKDLSMSITHIVKNNITVNAVENCYGNFPSAINLLTKNIISASDFDSEQIPFATLDKALPKIKREDMLKCNYIVKFE